MDTALGLLAQMGEEDGQFPDEIVFNSLLMGCAATKNVALAEKLLEDMRSCFHVVPTSGTFSVMIKVYVQSNRPDRALQMLHDMERVHGVVPRARLFNQLLLAFVRTRSGKELLETYKLLCAQHGPAPGEENTKLLFACAQSNMIDPGTSFLSCVLANKGSVSLDAVQALFDRATGKRHERAKSTLRALGQEYNLRLRT